MKKYLYLLTFILAGFQANAQCLVNSLTINTGYDPISGTAITGSPDGGTPVTDPHWILTAVTPGVATAVTTTIGSGLPGLVEVIPGNNADVITKVGGWATNPFGKPGGWISCVNSSYYITDGTGITSYRMTLGRPFRLCSSDSVVLDFYIANDNYVVSTNIDGSPLGFSQPPGTSSTYYSTFSHYTQTVFLTPGTHTFNIVVENYNVSTVGANPTGLDIYGTVSSKTGIASLVSESVSTCASYACPVIPNTCDVINLPDTLHPCKGDVIILPATLTGTDSVISYNWTPATGLSSTSILTPSLTVGSSGWYDLTVKSLINYNLVINGDFSGGNMGFSSGYIYSPPPSTILYEGYYSVDTDPYDVHTGFSHFGDHTTGTGEMMILNGAPTPVDVWCETISVNPNTDYDFSAWFANASPGGIGTYPILQFRINGTLIGTPVTISSPVGTWVSFFSMWNSGLSTTANICIYDATTSAGGNDFVIDDISFRQYCSSTDSVYIAVVPPDTTYSSHDTSICSAAAPLTLSSPAGYLSYLWNTGATTSSISVSTGGTYWVYNSAACSKTAIDTFHVAFIPSPVVNLGNDTAFCEGFALTLTSTQPAGYGYRWSTGTTATSIVVSTSGTYWLTVANGSCTTTDTIHVTISPLPIVDLGPDYVNCHGKPDTLQSSVTYTAPVYLWNDASTASSLVATTTGTYWLQVNDGGCIGSDTTLVTILYDTLNFYNHDTAICRGASVYAFTTGNPMQTYQWTPTAGVPVSNIGSPTIIPDTSATYMLTTSMDLCPDIIDSFHIDVQPNPHVYIGDNRMVCQFDTIHINAAVTPSWYKHYIFRWTPANYIDNTNSTSVVFTAGSYTQLMFKVSTPAGCTETDSAEVIVHPGNFLKFDTTFNICPRDTVQFKPTGGIAYVWEPAIYLDDPNSGSPWVRAITSQQYRVIGTSSFGCRDTLHVTVNVHPAGVMYLGNSVTLYPGESYHIAPQTNCTYFTWFPSVGLDNAHTSNPVAKPEVSTKYIVNAYNEWGCKVTDSIDIIVDPETLLALPNAFTPGTGINKDFTIIKRGEATLSYFRVFNRWGNKVFETNNIDKGWDGTYNGTPQPFDVYVYEVEAVTKTGKEFFKHGNVTLIR